MPPPSMLLRVASLLLASCRSVQGLQAMILADTNRDGRVDVTGHTDIAGKDQWTPERGAVFLANIGDTDRRCSKLITNDTPDSEVDNCHDAIDNIQRNPRYLAPLRTVPNYEVSDSARGTVFVSGDEAANKTRIFHRQGDDWVYVSRHYIFDSKSLRNGLELGVDARDVRRPNGWDGRATVHFVIVDGETKAEDSVALRVAPVLTHHHAQLPTKIFTVADTTNSTSRAKFVKDFKQQVVEAGITESVYLFQTDDIWAQDFFEPGYMSIPGKDGPKVLRVLIRSAQQFRPAGNLLFQLLRSDSVAAVQYLEDGHTRDAAGNLETIPPFEHNGTRWPAGRAIVGTAPWEKPFVFDFLTAQETQTPLELNTSWLFVGHVDEFIQFLPADNERGWVVMVDDPLAGLKLLQDAQKQDFGNISAVSRPVFPSDDGCLPKDTINQLLSKTNLTGITEYCAEHIERNILRLKQATGITDEDIFRLPALFHTDFATRDCPSKKESRSSSASVNSGWASHPCLSIMPPSSTRQRRQTKEETTRVLAVYPGIINGVVLNDREVLAPNPWGPSINGVDILAAAARKVYAEAGMEIRFMDDWFSHHVEGGDVHCGSNSLRETNAEWW